MPKVKMEISASSDLVRSDLYIGEKQVDAAMLAAMLQADEAEHTQRIRFTARVFVAEYPNANFVRFRDEDMEAFGSSFAGQPFLRNHDTGDIGSRDGTMAASHMDGTSMVQEIDLTTRRGIVSFLEGQIDRFSIGWYYTGITCSVCGFDWRDYQACPHWAGRRYEDADGVEHLCEIIFEGPSGKETSAVNTPAVEGTGLLAQLMQAKEAHISRGKELREMDEETVVEETAAEAAVAQLDSGEVEPSAGTRQPDWVEYMRETAIATALQGADMSDAARKAVRASLRETDGPQEVEAAIERMRAALGAERDASVVHGIQPVTAGDMQDGLDRLNADYRWMLGVPDARMPDPMAREGGIRQLYLTLTGDYGWQGKFDPDQAQLANANSGTFAGVTLDAMNRLVQEYYNNEMTYRWFESILEVVPHDGTTHEVKMIMVDGLANLPTVEEGGAYTEAVVGDSKEEMEFSKKGQYVGITLEMIRKNSIARMRTIPRGLVQACTRTRSGAIASLFTANSGVGPTMADDNKALFHADHDNLATAAIALASWAAMRTRIWKQKLPGTDLPFGLWPRYALVPINTYDTTLTIFGYGAGNNGIGRPTSGGSAQEVNPYGENRPMDMRPMPVPVPEFSDTNDWAAVVDPMEHAPIKMAYANAPGGNIHPMPELFEAESPNGGLMFTNDTLPIKIRDWFAFGVATHVGLGKSNVA